MTHEPAVPERDEVVDRAWRANSRENPPAALDQRILAAAHRAVGSRPQEAKGAEATRPQRWWMPLAAAATIGAVVIGVLQTMPQDGSGIGPGEPVADRGPRLAKESTATPSVAASPDGGKVMEERDVAAGPGLANADSAAPRKVQDAATSMPSAMGSREPAPPASPMTAPTPSPQATVPPSPKTVAAPITPLPSASPPISMSPPPAASPSPATAAAPPAAANEREVGQASGKLDAARAPEPFPAAPSSRKSESMEMKRTAPDGGRSPADAAAIAQARQAPMPGPAEPESDARANMRKDVSEDRRQRSAGAARTAPNATAASAEFAAAAPAPSMRAKNAAASDEARARARDPDAWIARIRKLRDDGNAAQARRELREFRDLVPDADKRLPPDLKTLESDR